MGYVLKAALKNKAAANDDLGVSDLTDIEIRYFDDLLEAESHTEMDVGPLIDQLREPEKKVKIGYTNKVREKIDFSSPMKSLIFLGAKARGKLQSHLHDTAIQKEVVLVLGASGDESTVPLLIDLYPGEDAYLKMQSGAYVLRDPKDRLRIICLTYALSYLTCQQIGRASEGADFKHENRKLWQDWWATAGAKFKVPQQKPAADWLPVYPRLSEAWAKGCRESYAEHQEDN